MGTFHPSPWTNKCSWRRIESTVTACPPCCAGGGCECNPYDTTCSVSYTSTDLITALSKLRTHFRYRFIRKIMVWWRKKNIFSYTSSFVTIIVRNTIHELMKCYCRMTKGAGLLNSLLKFSVLMRLAFQWILLLATMCNLYNFYSNIYLFSLFWHRKIARCV